MTIALWLVICTPSSMVMPPLASMKLNAPMKTLSPSISLSSCSITLALEMRVCGSSRPPCCSPNTGCQIQRRSHWRRRRFKVVRIVMRDSSRVSGQVARRTK